jgi:DNA-binding MarR family transcriptional regulator
MNENCDISPITQNLILQFLELEGNLIRLKMQFKAHLAACAREGMGHDGGRREPSDSGRPSLREPGMRRGSYFNPRTGQGRILTILKLQPEIEQKELGYLLDMSRQALAELLAKLEKAGYVTRVQSERDRRSYVVSLTDQGREVAEQVAAAEPDNNDDPLGLGAALNTLSPDEQQTLSDYLERISDAIRAKLGPSADPRDEFAEFFREKFFNRHGFDRRDFARFGFDRPGSFNADNFGTGNFGGGFGHDPRDHFDGRDPRSEHRTPHQGRS